VKLRAASKHGPMEAFVEELELPQTKCGSEKECVEEGSPQGDGTGKDREVRKGQVGSHQERQRE